MIAPLEMHLLKTQAIEMARSSSYLLVYQFASGTYIFAFSVSCTFLFSLQSPAKTLGVFSIHI